MLSLVLAPCAAADADALARAQKLECEGRMPEAMRVYRQAASQERGGPAALRLGEVFEHGLAGVARDLSESLLWYERARLLGEKVPTAGASQGPRRDLAAELAKRCAKDAAGEAAKFARTADAPVVVLEVKGGFRRGRGLDLPHFALYADRNVIYRAVARGAAAGAPVATHHVLQLAEPDYRALLSAIAPEGLQHLDATYDAVNATDPAVTVIHAWIRGSRKTVAVTGDDQAKTPPAFRRAVGAIEAFRANVSARPSPRSWPDGRPVPHAAAWQ